MNALKFNVSDLIRDPDDYTAHERGLAASTVTDLTDELRKAHLIIGLALNCIEGEARRHFIDDVRAAGLEGEGVTRANERRALLERVGVPA
jgi:hypothetical protein